MNKWTECVIDAEFAPIDGAFSYCPIEGDIDENAACMSYAKCLPDMLSKRAASQFIEYLDTPDCYNRYGIKAQSRCTACRLPVSHCDCYGCTHTRFGCLKLAASDPSYMAAVLEAQNYIC